MRIANEKHGDCCDPPNPTTKKAPAHCPACDTTGRAVKPVTIESLVQAEARERVGRADGFHFCANPTCEVAYFQPETGARIARGEVRVRIGQKETGAPRPVCYCFDHTVEEIEAEVRTTGTSKIADDITAKCRQGLDRCEETNPQGSCCLGNVRSAVKDAQQRTLGEPVAAGVGVGTGAKSAADPGSSSCAPSGDAVGASCCAPSEADAPTAPTGPQRSRAGLWATIGALVAAVLSSACCWLPLLLVAFGASAASVAGFFEAYRPVLLGVTALLLGSGLYLVYLRKPRCAPGQACAVPNRRLQRFNKVTLWIATSVVLGFALFPNYMGFLLRTGQPSALAAAPTSGETRTFRIEGMTCEACSITLRDHLQKVPGVARAEVSFDKKTARVAFAKDQAAPSDPALLQAIQDAGYQGKLAQ